MSVKKLERPVPDGKTLPESEGFIATLHRSFTSNIYMNEVLSLLPSSTGLYIHHTGASTHKPDDICDMLRKSLSNPNGNACLIYSTFLWYNAIQDAISPPSVALSLSI